MKVRDDLKEFSDDVDLVLPPWIAFPELSKDDLFWRMERGEDYIKKISTFLEKFGKEKYAAQFPKVKLFTIDSLFGGWAKAQKTHFADGGAFDQIYQPTKN